MGQAATTFLPAAVVLGLCILAHEFGHFLVARLSGMRVRSFAVGFGPALLNLRRRGVSYRVNLIPLGGYVDIAGLHPDDPDEPGAFHLQPRWKRLLTLLAGPVMNVVLAAVVFAVIGVVFGRSVGETKVIDRTLPHSPAERAGVRPGDEILRVDELTVEDREDVRLLTAGRPGRRMTLAVQRNGRILSIGVTPTRERKKVMAQVVRLKPAEGGGGLMADDTVLAIDKTPVDKLQEAKLALELRGGDVVAFTTLALPKGIPVARQASKEALEAYLFAPKDEHADQAKELGMKPDEQIVEIAGGRLQGLEQLQISVQHSHARTTELSVLRGGKAVELSFNTEMLRKQLVLAWKKEEQDIGLIGVVFRLKMQKQSVVQAIQFGLAATWERTVGLFAVFRALPEVGIEGFSGPIGIFRVLGETARLGLSPFLDLFGFISLNLALFNLVPIPGLDGARLAFLGAEAVRRRAIDRRKESYVHLVGLAFLVLLLLWISVREVGEMIGMRFR